MEEPPLGHWTAEYLAWLLESREPEGQRIDYKEASLLDDSKLRDKATKEVSAFANADGGTIIIGIKTAKQGNRREPAGWALLAPGTDWASRLPQIINSNTDPRLDSLQVQAIDITVDGQPGQALVVHVPRATRAIQASDLKYYQRLDHESLAMRGFQVRDVNNRLVGPDLVVEIGLRDGEQVSLTNDLTEVPLRLLVRNRANSVANYAEFRVLLPKVNLGGMHGYFGRSSKTPKILLAKGTTRLYEGQAAIILVRYLAGEHREYPPLIREPDGVNLGSLDLTVKRDYEKEPHLIPLCWAAFSQDMEPRSGIRFASVAAGTVRILDELPLDVTLTLDEIDSRDYWRLA